MDNRGAVDKALGELRVAFEPAKEMVWTLAEDYFLWYPPDKHSCKIIYEYEHAAICARIAEGYLLKMEEAIKALEKAVEESRQENT